jgi:hypothetical protein
MTEHTDFELNCYDGDVSSNFDTFECSAPRNAHHTDENTELLMMAINKLI